MTPELKFGTSGRRGKVVDLTQQEVYINALAELEYLQSLPRPQGGIVCGEEFFFAYDLRPSSAAFDLTQQGRGELAQAVESAIRDAGMRPVNLGRIPTPALTYYALSQGRGSIMVTGSHIPFDRNGYKTNTAVGELLKIHEAPINEKVRQVRKRISGPPFNEEGMFQDGHRDLAPENGQARSAYIARYTRFFAAQSLRGKRLLVYQHSAVGRDLLVEILEAFGAEVVPAGRSDSFVPIDTENIDAAQLAAIQKLVDESGISFSLSPPVSRDKLKLMPHFDAVVSTDGDSDRPLILGVDSETRKVRFFGGDLVGMIVAEYLGADAVVVPISCNDAIDRGSLKEIVEPKTRIGSPYVIAGMEAARARGKRAVCGWEANGGFLTGSDIERHGEVLTALPTRDAMLPILTVFFAAHEDKLALAELFARLPQRFSRAALLRQFPREAGLALVKRFTPRNEGEVEAIRTQLESFFTRQMGFGKIARLDYTDGVRMIFANGDVAHIRPSGNADELRIYAVADTQARADAIAQMAVAEPAGILRRMEKSI